MAKKLRVNYILPKSKANGPGTRFTIWVQGCSIHCPGCANRDTWDPVGGWGISVEDLVARIERTKGIDGVTLTGGEPLDQYDVVYDLCSKLFGKIPIFLTTGYELKQFGFLKALKILEVLDIVCAGPFDRNAVCKNEWRGSSNQRLDFLTDIGREQLQWPVVSKEVLIDDDGDALVSGFTK